MPAQRITKDSTETLRTYFAPVQEPPSSVTVLVYAPGVTSPASEAATVDSVSTTLSAAASAGATSLSVASASGISAGISYLAATNYGYLPVEVEAVSGTTLYLSDELPLALANGAAFVGWAVSHALTATETEHTGEGHALWTVTMADGTQHPWRQSFFVSKMEEAPTLTWPALARRFPLVSRLRPAEDRDGSETVEAGWADLRHYLDVRGVRPERIKSWDILEHPHALACVFHLVSLREELDPDEIDRWRDRYYTARESLLSNSREFWYDESENETTRADDAPRNISGGRLSR